MSSQTYLERAPELKEDVLAKVVLIPLAKRLAQRATAVAKRTIEGVSKLVPYESVQEDLSRVGRPQASQLDVTASQSTLAVNGQPLSPVRPPQQASAASSGLVPQTAASQSVSTLPESDPTQPPLGSIFCSSSPSVVTVTFSSSSPTWQSQQWAPSSLGSKSHAPPSASGSVSRGSQDPPPQQPRAGRNRNRAPAETGRKAGAPRQSQPRGGARSV